MIKRHMQERFAQLLLQRARQRRLPCARRTIDQDDLARSRESFIEVNSGEGLTFTITRRDQMIKH